MKRATSLLVAFSISACASERAPARTASMPPPTSITLEPARPVASAGLDVAASPSESASAAPPIEDALVARDPGAVPHNRFLGPTDVIWRGGDDRVSVWMGLSERTDGRLPTTVHTTPEIRCVEILFVIRNEGAEPIAYEPGAMRLVGASEERPSFVGERWPDLHPGDDFWWLAPGIFQRDGVDMNTIRGAVDLSPHHTHTGAVSFEMPDVETERAVKAWIRGLRVAYRAPKAAAISTLFAGRPAR